jgi:hypothetical protein
VGYLARVNGLSLMKNLTTPFRLGKVRMQLSLIRVSVSMPRHAWARRESDQVRHGPGIETYEIWPWTGFVKTPRDFRMTMSLLIVRYAIYLCHGLERRCHTQLSASRCQGFYCGEEFARFPNSDLSTTKQSWGHVLMASV